MLFRLLRVITTGVLVGVVGARFAPLRAAEPLKPNIVFILADDLGYGDAGCYNPGSKIPTPNIDQLAQEGMRFTDAHAPASVCTPTRYALLTGRYAWRTRLQRNVLGPFSQPLIAERQLTVPAMLREQGYATACIGKWHLGWGWPKPGDGGKRDFTKPIPDGPTTRGFDRYFGTDVPNYPPYCFLENDRAVGIPSAVAPVGRDSFNIAGPMVPGWKLVEVLPELERRAVDYIEQASKDGKPFFLYLPLTSPHYPVVPAAEFQGKSKAGDYGDFVVQTDHLVGEVLAALKRSGVADEDSGDPHERQRPGDFRRGEPRRVRPAEGIRAREHGNPPRCKTRRLGGRTQGAVHRSLAWENPGQRHVRRDHLPRRPHGDTGRAARREVARRCRRGQCQHPARASRRETNRHRSGKRRCITVVKANSRSAEGTGC